MSKNAIWFLIVLFPVISISQRGFQLVHAADQIKIYRPPLDEGYITYNASMSLPNTSVSDVREVLQNYAQHTEWMYRCLESRKLNETSGTIYLYQVSKSNWPFRNRDNVLRVEVLQDDPDRYRLRFTAEPEYVSEKKKYVRIQKFHGEWDIRAEKERVTISMFTSFRPEVNFPKTFFRTLSKRIPLVTFNNLRERL